jgi:hypothetical protein
VGDRLLDLADHVLFRAKHFNFLMGLATDFPPIATGVIPHGPATKPKRLTSIARRFGLVKWRTELDQHYLTGEDTDGLFDEG